MSVNLFKIVFVLGPCATTGTSDRLEVDPDAGTVACETANTKARPFAFEKPDF